MAAVEQMTGVTETMMAATKDAFGSNEW